MKNEKIIFRRANDSEKNQILSLFKICFAKSEVNEKNSELWDWQYIKNPDGEPYIAVAEKDKKIIGHYAIIPYIYLNEKNQQIKVGLVVDVMVDPNFQRRGIFVNISIFAIKNAMDKMNLDFLIGFPFTGTTYSSVIPGHKKVGWILTKKIYFYLLPIKFDNIISFQFPKLHLLSGIIGYPLNFLFLLMRKMKKVFRIKTKIIEKKMTIMSERCSFFNLQDEQFYKKALQNKFRKKRNINFLSWRFCEKPNSNYKIVRLKNKKNNEISSIGIYSIEKINNLKMGVLIDLEGIDKNAIEIVLNRIINDCEKIKCDAIVLIDYKGSPFKKARRNFFFFNTRKYYQIINWNQKNISKINTKETKYNYLDFDIF